MTSEILEIFQDAKTGEICCGGTLFQCKDACLLHDSKGHILILDSCLANRLRSHQIPNILQSHLASRGFLERETIQNIGCLSVKPEFFMIDFTNRCNMACKYCLRDIHSNGESIKEDILWRICQYIQNYCNHEKIANISIQAWGGEPLLELDSILKMKKWIRPTDTNVHFSIETNATLLTSEVLDILYNEKIGIGISIDGTRECHDRQRVFMSGGETHTIVEQNLRLALKKYGSRLGTITTITRLNFEKIEDILEYFAVDVGLTNVKFNFVHKSKFSAGCESLCLTEEEISATELRMLCKLTELAERGYSLVEKNITTKLKNLLFHEYSDICLSRGCMGGRKMIVFDRDGNIFPCELTDFPEESIGNIHQADKTLIELVSESVGKRKYFIPKKVEKCENCLWYVNCGGGCTVRIMNSGTLPPDIDKVECAINSVLYPAMIELILTKPHVVNKMLGYEAVII